LAEALGDVVFGGVCRMTATASSCLLAKTSRIFGVETAAKRTSSGIAARERRTLSNRIKGSADMVLIIRRRLPASISGNFAPLPSSVSMLAMCSSTLEGEEKPPNLEFESHSML
jgi:hypothetical protein